MCEQNASYLAKHSKNLYQICLKIIQNALKYPLQHVNFQKMSGGTCSRTTLELFLFLNQFQICSAEKNTLKKNVKIMPPPPPPPPYKISRSAAVCSSALAMFCLQLAAVMLLTQHRPTVIFSLKFYYQKVCLSRIPVINEIFLIF